MEPATVVGLVTDLVASYDSCLQFYTAWKTERIQQNHYKRRSRNECASSYNCAVGASLSISGQRIMQVYDAGFGVMGPEFSKGDGKSICLLVYTAGIGVTNAVFAKAICRQLLLLQLEVMQDRAHILRRAVLTVAGLLDLNDIVQCSETARMAAISALTRQYQRFARGSPFPRHLPIPPPRSSSLGSTFVVTSGLPSSSPDPIIPMRRAFLQDDEKDTHALASRSELLHFQSEPPSPPLTPKSDDLESVLGTAVSVFSEGGTGTAPKNSVFSIFCPGAMALQVDVTRAVPNRQECRCGFRWMIAEREDCGAFHLKEGFQLTNRFLAKSHCHGSTYNNNGGYGCVLCTSTGRAETYDTALLLRDHINAAHTKWQMLHDRDMT